MCYFYALDLITFYRRNFLYNKYHNRVLIQRHLYLYIQNRGYNKKLKIIHIRSKTFVRFAGILSSFAYLSAWFDRCASRWVLYSSHKFKFIFCKLILKIKSFLLYCKCKLYFLKVTKSVFGFKWKIKFILLKALLSLKKSFSSWHSRFAIDFLFYIH